MPTRAFPSRTALAALLCATLAHAAAPPTPRFIPISHTPAFADVVPQLQALVNANGHAPTATLCVVGQKIGPILQAQIYWPAENKLILWIPNRDDPQAMVDSKRYLDLTKDVVSGSDVGGSTYRITRAQADATIRACHTHGQNFTIHRAPRAAPH